MKNKLTYMLSAIAVVSLTTWAFYSAYFYNSEVKDASPLEHVIYERTLGNSDALVVIEEYSSLTCPACSYFYQEILPSIKKRFIENGKVQFQWKHFPHNSMADTAAALSNLVNQEDFWLLVGDLYRSLNLWYNNEKALKQIVSNYVDLDRLTDFMDNHMQDVLDKINRQTKSFATKLNVTAVPTIFINGVKYEDTLTVDNLAEAIKNAYQEAQKKLADKNVTTEDNDLKL